MLLVGLLIAAQFAFGLGATIYGVNQVSLRQAITPARLQGRVHVTLHVATAGAAPPAALAGGLLGTSLGLRERLLLAAGGGIAALLWIVCSPIWRLERIPELLPDGGRATRDVAAEPGAG